MSRGSFSALLQDTAIKLGFASPVVLQDLTGNGLEGLRGQIRGPTEDVALGGEEGRGRPAAHVIALVHLRMAVIVDPDGEKLPVEQVDDPGGGIRGLIYYM